MITSRATPNFESMQQSVCLVISCTRIRTCLEFVGRVVQECCACLYCFDPGQYGVNQERNQKSYTHCHTENDMNQAMEPLLLSNIVGYAFRTFSGCRWEMCVVSSSQRRPTHCMRVPPLSLWLVFDFVCLLWLSIGAGCHVVLHTICRHSISRFSSPSGVCHPFNCSATSRYWATTIWSVLRVWLSFSENPFQWSYINSNAWLTHALM